MLLIIFIINTIINKSLKIKASILIIAKIAKTIIINSKLTYINLLLFISLVLYKLTYF